MREYGSPWEGSVIHRNKIMLTDWEVTFLKNLLEDQLVGKAVTLSRKMRIENLIHHLEDATDALRNR